MRTSGKLCFFLLISLKCLDGELSLSRSVSGGAVVALRNASIIFTLWQCGRFIKRALPAFITSIIKVNPIMFLPEILNILQPDSDVIDRQQKPQRVLSRFDWSLLSAFKRGRHCVSEIFKGIWLSSQRHQILNHSTTPNGLLQRRMLN